MAYVRPNYKTKKALREAVAAGDRVTIFQPGGIFDMPKGPSTATVEGPHFPAPHRWYAVVEYDETMRVTSVK